MSQTLQSALDKQILLQFKSGLRGQQTWLQKSIQEAENTIRELSHSGPGDAADAASRQSLGILVIAQSRENRNRLRLVELALERIRAGTFGTCDECGGGIGLRRLQAVPWTRHCIQCQERYEQVGVIATAESAEAVSA
jgi:DnaK suppressor protein